MKRAPLLGLGLCWPAVGQACAVCGAADRNQSAFLGMTIMLSLLPLAMFGVGAWWLRGKIRAAETRERETSTSPGAGQAGEVTRG